MVDNTEGIKKNYKILHSSTVLPDPGAFIIKPDLFIVDLMHLSSVFHLPIPGCVTEATGSVENVVSPVTFLLGSSRPERK